ncbi:MAG: HEPN domain-containing protein [Deltaproteobacteria bacterium]|nr:HEPN domain-containing protein [Deltaproteobacteria bacterium]
MMNEKVKQWIIKADNDITIAGKDLKTDNPVTDAICFHAQQSAEKYLKAYLVFKDIEPEKTHKIERLVLTCITFDATFSALKAGDILTEYAVEFRYPDDFYIPDIEEAKEAYNLALKVKDFVLEWMK